MSVAMTSCGQAGWVSDRAGYRYDPINSEIGRPWPPMPPLFAALARRAAERAGFSDFVPDACLNNRYTAGARLPLHQDRNERDLGAPVVSVSLGLPATFLWDGQVRSGRPQRLRLRATATWWSGAVRRAWRSMASIPWRPATPTHGDARLNLTFSASVLTREVSDWGARTEARRRPTTAMIPSSDEETSRCTSQPTPVSSTLVRRSRC